MRVSSDFGSGHVGRRQDAGKPLAVFKRENRPMAEQNQRGIIFGKKRNRRLQNNRKNRRSKKTLSAPPAGGIFWFGAKVSENRSEGGRRLQGNKPCAGRVRYPVLLLLTTRNLMGFSGRSHAKKGTAFSAGVPCSKGNVARFASRTAGAVKNGRRK